MSTKRSMPKNRLSFLSIKPVAILCVVCVTSCVIALFYVFSATNQVPTLLPNTHLSSVYQSANFDENYLPPIDPDACLNLTPHEREQRFAQFGPVVERVDTITKYADQFIYIREPKILLYFLLKGGSRALLGWLYEAVVGDGPWSDTFCQTYIQDIHSTCWSGHAFFMSELDPITRLRILTSDDVLRVAIQRDPYQRLVSAFKGKYACGREVFKGDPSNSSVLQLREQSKIRLARPDCMTISEFAQALRTLRTKGHLNGITQPKFAEGHVRIQLLHDQEIDYDLVLDPRYFKYPKHLKLLYDRLPFKHLVKPLVSVQHASTDTQLQIPPQDDAELKAYAQLSKPIKLRSCDRFRNT